MSDFTNVVVLSGPIAVGKSELADRLVTSHLFTPFKTSMALKRRLQASKREITRQSLQEYGAKLDDDTDHNWICDELKSQSHTKIIVDCCRTAKQVASIRNFFGWRTIHIHLTATINTLSERLERRKEIENLDLFENIDIDVALAHKTESEEFALKQMADLVLDTDRCMPEDIYVRVAARLGLFSQPESRLVDVLIGGQFGSEGKGQLSAYLSQEYDYVLRVGGPNAGHRVASPGGSFTYIHLPSGCADNNSKILIGPGSVIDPTDFIKEVSESGVDPKRITIDPLAMTISPSDVANERVLSAKISSTGRGVGAATARKILDRGKSDVILAKDHPSLRNFCRPIEEILEYAFASDKRVLLEGTQGSLLSIHHGYYPYVTSRDTNAAGCLSEAGISPRRVRKVVMVTRPYPIRVGNPAEGRGTSGPIESEISTDVIAARAGLDPVLLKKQEVASRTGKPRRFGEFSWAQFKKSCNLNTPTDIALTFADYIDVSNRNAFRFEQLTIDTILFIEALEQVAQAPVSLINTKFDQRSVIDRRNWALGRGMFR